MKIIQNCDNTINLVLSTQKINNDKEYRKISFCYCVNTDDNNVLAYNTLTKELLLLSTNEADILNNVINDGSDFYRYLIEHWFLVEVKTDDYKLNIQVRDFVKLLQKTNGIKNFTILPTSDCNARCFYCFEYGVRHISMTEKTALDTADYISKTACDEEVKLHWFGGEPLYNSSAIDTICASLREKGISFKSSMLSNGYLFDDEIVYKAKNEWNLKTVQITLDGTEDVYNRCKNYIYDNKESPFRIVISNINRLIDNDIAVDIRLNIGKHNEKDLYNLVDYLELNLNSTKNISIYVRLLYDEKGIVKNKRSIEERHRLTESLYKLEDYILNKGLKKIGSVHNKLKINRCMADSDNSIVILPDGKLTKCDTNIDTDFIGDIYTGITDYELIDIWRKPCEPVKLCYSCPTLPECIKLEKCPDNESFGCDDYVQKGKLLILQRQMLKTYKNFQTKTDKRDKNGI